MKGGKILVGVAIAAFLAAGSLAAGGPASADISHVHPQFALLDGDGRNVLETGNPVSTMKTCGQCHDSEFIETHSYHSDQGLTSMTQPGDTGSGRPWDTSLGWFGKWNPITYRYLTPEGDALLDLGTAAWIETLGYRQPGGGPATTSRDGGPLEAVPVVEGDPETHVLDLETDSVVAWDWEQSGVEELNCFVCHTPHPDNDARVQTLQSGQFEWANTATLYGTGIVSKATDGTWEWNPGAFDEDGKLAPQYVEIQDPSNDSCGICHGIVHSSDQPLDEVGSEYAAWETLTTGQVFSAQRISESALNLANKQELDRSWDIHAERLVKCTDCHHSLNNPIYLETKLTSYLAFDVRRADFGAYLTRPDHNLAKGQSAQGTLAPEFDYTMRSCDSCHETKEVHAWLPYADRHLEQLACETCHIPAMYEPAAGQYDWTVIHMDGSPVTVPRGIEGPTGETTSLITGYEPVILKRVGQDGSTQLAPYNLVSSWFWIYGDPARPVRQIDLERVFLDDGSYRPEIIAAFDGNGDGTISETELAIDTEGKETAVAGMLEGIGLENPRIDAEIQPYSISHGVTGGGFATRDCQTCHSKDSRLTEPMLLAAYVPGGVMPHFVGDTNTETTGSMAQATDGSLWYQPTTSGAQIGILGSRSGGWIDWVGWILLILTVIGIAIHGSLRWLFWRKLRKVRPSTEVIHIYEPYERFWHWLQAIAIIILIITGAIIHWPGWVGAAGFTKLVIAHNVVGAILVANALLSIIWHVASGAIRQYIPRPRGFFDQAVQQAIFYVRGIFRGEPHPFEKDARHKMNPLQQMTYVVILNVLLPFQMITGIVIWGAQHWPSVTTALGGLGFLLPAHTLGAWLFATFVILHVYLTTTGATPLAAIRAMISGWEVVEVHEEEVAT
jgi:thiosulfate reductase cytochrome b subunit